MAGRTRLISVPSARGGDDRHGFRQLAGSMGQMAPDPAAPMDEGVPATKFEAPTVDDVAWQRTVAMREAAEGLPPVNSPRWEAKTDNVQVMPPSMSHGELAQRIVNLDGLPEKFTLEVESKPDGWWKVSAPAHHAGLFIAHQDLIVALTDAPGALAQILRLDCPVPAKPKRRRS